MKQRNPSLTWIACSCWTLELLKFCGYWGHLSEIWIIFQQPHALGHGDWSDSDGPGKFDKCGKNMNQPTHFWWFIPPIDGDCRVHSCSIDITWCDVVWRHVFTFWTHLHLQTWPFSATTLATICCFQPHYITLPLVNQFYIPSGNQAWLAG